MIIVCVSLGEILFYCYSHWKQHNGLMNVKIELYASEGKLLCSSCGTKLENMQIMVRISLGGLRIDMYEEWHIVMHVQYQVYTVSLCLVLDI